MLFPARPFHTKHTCSRSLEFHHPLSQCITQCRPCRSSRHPHDGHNSMCENVCGSLYVNKLRGGERQKVLDFQGIKGSMWDRMPVLCHHNRVTHGARGLCRVLCNHRVITHDRSGVASQTSGHGLIHLSTMSSISFISQTRFTRPQAIRPYSSVLLGRSSTIENKRVQKAKCQSQHPNIKHICPTSRFYHPPGVRAQPSSPRGFQITASKPTQHPV